MYKKNDYQWGLSLSLVITDIYMHKFEESFVTDSRQDTVTDEILIIWERNNKDLEELIHEINGKEEK